MSDSTNVPEVPAPHLAQSSPTQSRTTAPAPRNTSRARTKSRPYPSPANRDRTGTLPTQNDPPTSDNAGLSSPRALPVPLKISASHLYQGWYRRKFTLLPNTSQIPVSVSATGNGKPKSLNRLILDRWNSANQKERCEWKSVAAEYRRKMVETGRWECSHEEVVKRMEEDGWAPVIKWDF